MVWVHALGLAGPVANALGGFFYWDPSWDDECWLGFESGHDCHKASLRFA